MPPAEEAPDLRRLVRSATTALAEAGVPSPDVDARALAAHLLGVEQLVLALPPTLPPDFPARYAELVQRRRRREPLQLITGAAYFRHLRLRMRAGVFIPRPETEVVAGHAITFATRSHGRGEDAAGQPAAGPLVVDLCCGAGPIALSVAHEVPGSTVLAIDANPAAVDLTRKNAEAYGLAVQVQEGDVGDPGLLAEHDGQVDVLAANPPYIPPGAHPRQQEVRKHDPHAALYGGGPDGLDVPRAVIGAATRLLRSGGMLVMEHAEVQGEAARTEVAATGAFTEIRTAADLSGRPRMVIARRR